MSTVKAAILTVALVLALLAFDFSRVIRYKTPVFEYDLDVTSEAYDVFVEVSEIRFNDARSLVQANLMLEVRAPYLRSDREIERFTFSLQHSEETATRTWHPYPATWAETGQTGEVFHKITKTLVDTISTTKPVEILSTTIRQSVFYPFDTYELSFAPDGRVTEERDKESVDVPMRVARLKLDFSNSNFYTTCKEVGTSIRCDLRRQLFIRVMSVSLLFVSVIFFGKLIQIKSPDDVLPKALGFFAALWGIRSIIVPKTFTVFPTVVDYVVLAFFLILFIVIVSLVSQRNSQS